MEPGSPDQKENKDSIEDAAKNQKEKSSMGKNAKIAAIFGIIEVISLVLDEKAEDFSEPARYYPIFPRLTSQDHVIDLQWSRINKGFHLC